MYHHRLSIADILLEEIVMYLRKSRSDDPTLTVQEVLRNHEKELDDWCERNLGGKVPQENRYKEIVSGEKMSERPEINKVLKELEKPNKKYLLTNEPQRLSRGYLDEIGKLVLLLRHNHITVITPSKIYDLEDKYDREAFERELKRGNEYLEYFKEIQKRGKDRKVADGEYIGGQRPFGYDKIQYKEGKRTVKTLAINPEEAEIVRMMFKWYAYDGLSVYAVAKRLNEMGIKAANGKRWEPENGLKELLRNPLYIGKIRWGYQKNVTTVENQKLITRKLKQKEYQISEGLHDAIIDEETFNRALAVRKTRVPKKIKSQLVNPFAGIIRCKACGKPLLLHKDSKNVRLICPNTVDCPSVGIFLNEITDLVCKTMEECIEDFSFKLQNTGDNEFEEHQRNIEILKKRLQTLEQTELSQWEAQSSPDLSLRMPAHIFKQLNDKVLKDKEETKNALENLLSTAPTKINYEEKIVTLKTAIEYLKDESVKCEVKNEYLKEILKVIRVYREKGYRLTKAEAEMRGIPLKERGATWFLPKADVEIVFRE